MKEYFQLSIPGGVNMYLHLLISKTSSKQDEEPCPKETRNQGQTQPKGPPFTLTLLVLAQIQLYPFSPQQCHINKENKCKFQKSYVIITRHPSFLESTNTLHCLPFKHFYLPLSFYIANHISVCLLYFFLLPHFSFFFFHEPVCTLAALFFSSLKRLPLKVLFHLYILSGIQKTAKFQKTTRER